MLGGRKLQGEKSRVSVSLIKPEIKSAEGTRGCPRKIYFVNSIFKEILQISRQSLFAHGTRGHFHLDHCATRIFTGILQISRQSLFAHGAHGHSHLDHCAKSRTKKLRLSANYVF
jgi:hypothetical protein